MEQTLPFSVPHVCVCDDFIPPHSDSSRGVDDSSRDNDEGDNEVFVPLGGGPLCRAVDAQGAEPLGWLPLPAVTHALRGSKGRLPCRDL